MAVAFDAETVSTRTSSADPHTFNHTPVGTPRGVIVTSAHGATNTDHIVGITYGGVALTRAKTNIDSATEPGRVDIWHLGSSIPTGTQEVLVDLASATADDFEFTCITFTAVADTVIQDSDGLDDDRANPSVTLQYGGKTCIAVGVVYSGVAAPTSITAGANCTAIGGFDGGQWSTKAERQTTPGSSDFTIAFTIASDDCAFSAAAITESSAVTHNIAADFPLGLTIDTVFSAVEKVIAADFPLGLSIESAVTLETFISTDAPLGLAIDVNVTRETFAAADMPLALDIVTALIVERFIASDMALPLDIVVNLTVEGQATMTTRTLLGVGT